MASVSVVSSTEFRANLSQPQVNASEDGDPFSLLLNSVADVKADAKRPDAPQVPDRRKDAPAKQPKPEADADRQAKRQAKDSAKPEAKPQPESTAPVKETAAEDETEEADSDGNVSAEALLLAAIGEPEQPVVPQVATDGEAAVQTESAPVSAASAEAAADVQTAPALAAAVADAAKAPSAETQAAQTVQNSPAAKPLPERAPVATQTEGEGEIAIPKITPETISSLLRPLKAQSSFDAQLQTQTQPGAVNVSAAPGLHGPAHLEMLNAALNKHMQLSLGFEANDAAPDVQKLLVSSNAVAPNFAMTVQANAPVQVQTQQVAEAARTVPVDQIAVEIAARANRGERRFDIRLDPPELGRIDVRLEIDGKGNTTTKLIVERAETLDMLQRDARGLEKALQNAGLKTDSGSLQFSLQQDTQTQHGHQNHAPEMRGRSDFVRAEDEAMTEVSINSASLAAQLRGGVDIRI